MSNSIDTSAAALLRMAQAVEASLPGVSTILRAIAAKQEALEKQEPVAEVRIIDNEMHIVWQHAAMIAAFDHMKLFAAAPEAQKGGA